MGRKKKKSVTFVDDCIAVGLWDDSCFFFPFSTFLSGLGWLDIMCAFHDEMLLREVKIMSMVWDVVG